MAVGPSHFLDRSLDAEWAHLVWEHSVLPYIAEQFHGQPERVEEFALENLLGDGPLAFEEEEQDATAADGEEAE